MSWEGMPFRNSRKILTRGLRPAIGFDSGQRTRAAMVQADNDEDIDSRSFLVLSSRRG